MSNKNRRSGITSGNMNNHKRGQKFPPILYGLEGIMDLFGVSKATASRYANTFLSESVTKKGNKIIVDTGKALECFGVKDPERFINQSSTI